jgi:hypothetical protein
MYCEYKDILGTPNEGFLKHYFGFAIFDLIGTVIIAFILMIVLRKNVNRIVDISNSLLFGIILLILLIIAEWLHHIFCVV